VPKTIFAVWKPYWNTTCGFMPIAEIWSVMGLTRCYKTTVFYIYKHYCAKCHAVMAQEGH